MAFYVNQSEGRVDISGNYLRDKAEHLIANLNLRYASLVRNLTSELCNQLSDPSL